MPYIVVSSVCSTNCSLHYAMDNPTSDTMRCNLGSTEQQQVSACGLETNVVFGSLDNTIVELLGRCPPCSVDIASSTMQRQLHVGSYRGMTTVYAFLRLTLTYCAGYFFVFSASIG